MPPIMGSLPSREGDAPHGDEATSPIWTYLRETMVDRLYIGDVYRDRARLGKYVDHSARATASGITLLFGAKL
jgi:hypothetical protein